MTLYGLVCNNIKYSPIRESVRNELCEHIIEGKEAYKKEGLNDKEAERKALIDMGTPEQISADFNKIYRRKLDWKMLIIFVLLVSINALLITTVAFEKNNMQYIIRNVSYIFVGIILSIAIYFINYKKIQKWAIRFRRFRYSI